MSESKDTSDDLARYALETLRSGFSGPTLPPFAAWDDIPVALRDLLRVAVMVGQLNPMVDQNAEIERLRTVLREIAGMKAEDLYYAEGQVYDNAAAAYAASALMDER